MSTDRNGSSIPARAPILLPHHAWAWGATLLAVLIFAVDTFSPLETAVAVFYVIVIHLAASASRREYLVITSIGCIVLALLSYVIVHGAAEPGPSLIRLIVSLSAIGITSALVLRNYAVETKLREQANLLELTHDAIFVRDMSGTITYWNRGAEQLYGWLRSEAIGRPASQLLQTQFPAPHDSIRSDFLEDGRWEGNLVHVTKHGSQVVTSSRWSLQRDKDGRPVSVLDTNTDITTPMRIQEALHQTQAALAHAARVATLGELSASIAHEVNQPLAAIVTNGEAAVRWLARTEPDLREAQDALNRVIDDGRRASEVIRRIRSLTRKAEQRKSRLDLNTVIEESLALLEREITGRGIVLQLDLSETLAPVEADRIQIQQVLINILLNGVQAMDSVAPERRHLLIRSFADEGDTCVQVRDSGPGFDEETQKNLFSAFFTTKTSGMGMGLSICRSIVEAYGGRIWAARNDGPGATFHVSIPSHGAS